MLYPDGESSCKHRLMLLQRLSPPHIVVRAEPMCGEEDSRSATGRDPREINNCVLLLGDKDSFQII